MISQRAKMSVTVQYAAAGDDLPARPLLRRWIQAALVADAANVRVVLRFVEEAESRALNRRHRRKDHPTNVLSFVYDDEHSARGGDIVLCASVLRRGAMQQGKLLDADALSIIEGALQVSEMTVRDIMIPRSQMDVVSIDDEPEQFIPFVMETRHSRFPVVGENKDDVVGILLAKELLNYYANPESFNLRDTLRPAVFVPESKRLNVLLRDFRANRNHIAIVVDEYGGVSGLVTIEDVLEQIVGDIEDEYDFDEAEDNIIPEAGARYRVKAQTEIAAFNEALGAQFSDEEFHTIGGLVLQAFGRLPKRGEATTIGNFRFKVVRADSRRIYTLQVERLAPEPDEDSPAGAP